MKNELFKHCEDCPCYSRLLNEKRKKQILRWNELFYDNLSKIKEVKLILLGESMPNDRYFYDKQSDYTENGLRYALRERLKMSSDDELFLYLQEKGIIIVDCAFCALYKLGRNEKDKEVRKQCATYCLQHYNKDFILNYNNVPICSFFPKDCGFYEDEIPELIITNKSSFPMYPYQCTDIVRLIKNI